MDLSFIIIHSKIRAHTHTDKCRWETVGLIHPEAYIATCSQSSELIKPSLIWGTGLC